MTPASVRALVEGGHTVSIEPGVGSGSGYPDDDYVAAGAAAGSADVEADLVVVVESPEAKAIAGAQAVLGFLEPLDDPHRLAKLATSGSTLFAFELVPRITRAQSVDALSSQATLAGYQAALEGAALCDRIFPMLTTAAGTLRPARVLVLGAGVAGLQAIATARRLGAVVYGFDVRAAAAEQVESLGARFVTVDLEPQDAAEAGGYARQLADDAEARLLRGLFEHVTAADVVVTTAAIPGRPAPRLVTAEMVAAMRPGSVVVDAAAPTGGNCDLSRPGETIVVDGVTIAAPLDLPSRSANHATQTYARNVSNFIELLTDDDGSLVADAGDEIVLGSTAARGGEVVHERVLALLQEGA